MERYDLPDGWEWRELAQVVEIGSEQVNPFRFPNDLFNYLALENIEQGSGKVIDFTPTPGKNIKSNKFKFTSKHVLYGKLRPYLRKAFAPDFEGVSATDLLPLLPDENNLDRKFLVWWLLSPQVIEYVVGKQAGVKMPRLRSNDLAQMPIPVPVLPEQQRIVAKIESLFEQSRTARTALTHVPVLMAQFRRAVLASAFRGELVEPDPNDEPAASLLERLHEARVQTRNKKSVEPIDTENLQELPAGWVWTSLEQLSWDADYGTSQKCDYGANDAPVIRIPNILQGKLNFDDLKFATKPEELDETNSVQPGDILIVRTNGSRDLIGRGAFIYASLDAPHYFASYLIRYRLLFPETVGNWIASIWSSPLIRGQIDSMVASTAGQYNLSVGRLNKVKLPLPPIGEQQRIVAKIEAMFAQADIIEQAAPVSLRRAEQVDQSILARAFRGELG